MQIDIPVYLNYTILVLGIIAAVVGIIRSILEIMKVLRDLKKGFPERKQDKRKKKVTTIWFLVGIILILAYALIGSPCKNPQIKITSPSNNELVASTVTLEGKAHCLPAGYKIAVLIRRKEQNGELEKWFIHPECASLEDKIDWKVPNIGMGTSNMDNFEFEVYAYAVNDSICQIITRITHDPTYQGTFKKPDEITGVNDWITIKRKSP